MIVRQKVFDTYWNFAAKRQAIFFKKFNNASTPWSDDPVLNTYKFCNTYRASDRVSQFLIKQVIYDGNSHEEEALLRIILFKLFNKIDTWQYLVHKLGEVSLRNFDFDLYSKLLASYRQTHGPIYHNAYMSCANKAYGYDKKHQNHLALVKEMILHDKLAQKIVKAQSFEELFLLLRHYPLIGDFMAYQLATDINYSEVTNFDENEFTVVGPGSQRGIHKCFQDLQGKSYAYIIRWMQENQEKEFARLGITFQSLWGRPLHLIDCQGLFCETDKYSRVAYPELKSNRKKIKATYKVTPQPIDYFYPPKWGINEKITASIMRT